MNIKSRAYFKTHHVGRMRNFNQEITKNSRKGPSRLFRKCIPVSRNCVRWISVIRTAGSGKICIQFSEIVSWFPENVSQFPKIVSLFLESGTRYSYSFCNLYDEKELGILWSVRLWYIFRKSGYIFGTPGYIFGNPGHNFGKPGYIFGRQTVALFWSFLGWKSKKCQNFKLVHFIKSF